ncbi:hypothetical protein ACS0TY_025384 [Phlomoides rotata]
MEFGSFSNVQDKNDSSTKRGGHEDEYQHEAPAPAPQNTFAEVNMEVAVTADEVTRAGGFGATDDISNIVPVASDFTDFEGHLRELRGYEEPEDKFAEVVEEHVAPESQDAFESVNMEPSVTFDEVTRAGGFGATDDISSFLPVASDFTDFEANLRGARDYEDFEEKINRPGLGWTGEIK